MAQNTTNDESLMEGSSATTYTRVVAGRQVGCFDRCERSVPGGLAAKTLRIPRFLCALWVLTPAADQTPSLCKSVSLVRNRVSLAFCVSRKWEKGAGVCLHPGPARTRRLTQRKIQIDFLLRSRIHRKHKFMRTNEPLWSVD